MARKMRCCPQKILDVVRDNRHRDGGLRFENNLIKMWKQGSIGENAFQIAKAHLLAKKKMMKRGVPKFPTPVMKMLVAIFMMLMVMIMMMRTPTLIQKDDANETPQTFGHLSPHPRVDPMIVILTMRRGVPNLLNARAGDAYDDNDNLDDAAT